MMKRTLMTTGLASTMALVAAAQTAPATAMNNPLLQKSKLTFGAPDFNRIQEGDYLPALKEGIRQQREEIQRIVNNKQQPTFANTVLAYEQCGQTLDRVSSIFYALVGAHKTPVIAQTQQEITPLLTDLQNEITFNVKLFQRIKYVYDHQRQ